MYRDVLVARVGEIVYLRHCTHMARTSTGYGLVVNRYGCANRHEAGTIVESRMVDVGDRTKSGVRDGWLEVLTRIGHGTSGVIVGHGCENDG